MRNDIQKWILGILCFIFTVYIFLVVAYSETHYVRVATYDNGLFIDKCGYKWKYNGNFKVGNKYELKMFTNNTDSIVTDDVIIEIKEIK